MKDRFLVTGATGFIGSNVVRALVKRGKHVSIFTREKKISWRLEDISDRLHVYRCDVAKSPLEKIVDAIAPTVIFHFAAFGVNPWETDLEQMIDTNIKGTQRLITAAKKHHFRLFINTGTSSEYGVKSHPMRETDNLEPVNDYGVTKAGATILVTKMALREKLPILTFRLFSPYGPYEHKKRLFPSVCLSAIEGKPIAVSTPKHVRDFVYIDDVVDAYIKATVRRCNPGEVMNIGMGREHSVGDVVKTIVKITKNRSHVLWNAVNDQGRQVEPPRWQADIAKAEKLLGWKPRTSFVEGIVKTVKWFTKHKSFYE